MADKMHLGDWTKQNVTIGGTGVLTLGPSPGYPTLAETVGVDNRTVYTILNSNLSPLEIGYGRLINATTFEREVIRKTYFDGTYSTGDSLPPVNVPAGCVFYTGPTEDLLELLTLEKMLLDFGNVAGATTVSLRASALKMNLTANATLTFADLPPPGVKYELTLHATSANAGTLDNGRGFLLTLPNTCFLGKNLCPAIPLLHDAVTIVTLTTVDGGTSWQVLWHNGHANIKDLGNITGTVNLDIRYLQSKAILTTGSASTLDIAGVDPACKLGEPAHFVIKNTSDGVRFVEFDADIFTVIGSTLTSLTVPLGYKLDFTVRKNPQALDADPAYDVWVNGINYDISASGLATAWNPSDKESGITLTSVNAASELTTSRGGTGAPLYSTVRAFGGKASGKWRLASRIDSILTAGGSGGSRVGEYSIGLANALMLLTQGVGTLNSSYALNIVISGSAVTLRSLVENTVTSKNSFVATPNAVGGVLGLLLNFDTGKGWFTYNNIVLNTGGNPEADTTPDFTIDSGVTYFPGASFGEWGSSAQGSGGIHTLLNEVQDIYQSNWPSFNTWTA